LGFVYEVGGIDFRKADANGRLTNLGKLSLQRWVSGISAIHFLFPSQKQASNVRTAKGPHYQATFQDFILAMQEYRGPDIRFVFYAPNCNHSTDYLFVINGAVAHQYTLAITWKKVKRRIHLDCHSVSTTSTLRQAAGNFADYGFYTSHNSNRKESITGHVMPALKPNSTEPEIVGLFVALTTFAFNTRPLWRLDNNHFALIDAATLKEFAQKIPYFQDSCSTKSKVIIFRLFLQVARQNRWMEKKAIVTRFPYGDRLLTMDEVVSELELPSTMPLKSRRRRYIFLASKSERRPKDILMKQTLLL
jgi:hypothetical protein